MNKLDNSVLDKISENNNEYRTKLRNLSNQIEEKTTSLVGELVTLSNYVIDFSKTINVTKEELANPIYGLVENYVIRDLRGVETVNEQFIDKINDRLKENDILTEEDKENFIGSLDNLLNNKYLEIVKIKRVNFTLGDGKNKELEEKFENFEKYIKTYDNINIEALLGTINNCKNEIYNIISNILTDISNLYLFNFVNGIKEALNSSIKLEDVKINEPVEDTIDDFKPFTPDTNLPEIDFPQIPSAFDGTEMQNVEDTIPEFPQIPSMPEKEELVSEVTPMDIPDVEPISLNKNEKKQYDVDEILKIAKSPVVSMTNDEEPKKDSFVSVSPIMVKEEKENIVLEFDESEIVTELINRLSTRLNKIKEKQSRLEEFENQVTDDELFVNSLIDSSNNKQKELDEFEEELNKKEEELKLKQKELNKKINDVLPFANAVMNVQKES